MTFKNLSINKKFTVSLLLLVIIPLIIIFALVNQSITKRLDAQNCQTNLEVLKQTEAALIGVINDVNYVSLEILSQEELQSYLVKDGSYSELETSKITIQYEIQALLDSRPYISRVSIFDDKGTLFQFGGYLTQEDFDGIEDIKALKGKLMWPGTKLNMNYISAKDRIYEVSALRVINDLKKMDHVLAYERVNVLESYICSLYEGIKSDSTSNIYIINEEGKIISSIDKSYLNKTQADIVYFPTLKEKSEGYFNVGETDLISYYKLSKPNWYIVKIDDRKSILNRSSNNIMMLVSIVLTLFFGITFIIIQNKTIIQPVGKLSDEVKKFRKGQYEIQMHTYAKDEIGELNQCFVDMGIYIQDLIEREYNSQIKAKEAQLMYLQSQINPHFLYNALDSIRWMAIKEKQKDIAIQVEALANLFKNALNEGKKYTTVEKEIKHLNDYLLIQKNRFGDKLDAKVIADESIFSQKVLNLILQPLVENAIVHGIEKKIGRGYIEVRLERNDDHIIYRVSDNGLGTDEVLIREKLRKNNESNDIFALDNLNQRIKMEYGARYGINFSSQLGVGTTIEIVIPYNDEMENSDETFDR